MQGNLVQIARVLKSNGTDGELVLGFRGISPEDISLKEPVFIEFDGLPVPFFIESFSIKGTSKALVRLCDVECAEDALEVEGREVFAAESFLPEAQYEEGDYSFLIGWTLADAKKGTAVGAISGFLDIPSNPCLEVRLLSGASAVVPLADELISEVDEKGKVLTMNIPEGLF